MHVILCTVVFYYQIIMLKKVEKRPPNYYRVKGAPF